MTTAADAAGATRKTGTCVCSFTLLSGEPDSCALETTRTADGVIVVGDVSLQYHRFNEQRNSRRRGPRTFRSSSS